MSSKSSKGKRKGKRLSVPRELPEIEKELQERLFAAGQVQYKIAVYTEELKSINDRLKALNHEGAARKKLADMIKNQSEGASNEQQSN